MLFSKHHFLGDEEKRQHKDSPDRGRNAWLVLAAVSVTNVYTYGFSSAFGVFREWYFRNPPFAGNQTIAYVGPMALGLLQVLSPFLVYLCNKYPGRQKMLMWFGAALMVASTTGAAFATTPVQFIISLGVFYGIGGSCIFAPSMSVIDGWFVERRALANGIFFSASSVAPASLSPLFAYTLDRYSPRTTLLGWAIFCAIMSLIALTLIRPRKRYRKEGPVSDAQNVSLEAITPTAGTGPNETETEPQNEGTKKQSTTYRFWTQPLFYLLCISTISQGLAHFMPALYMPTFATDLGISRTHASLLITYFQLMCAVFQPPCGAMVDRVGPFIPLLVTTLGASTAVLTLWGLGHTYPTLVVMMLLFGATSGPFVVFRSIFASKVVSSIQSRSPQSSQSPDSCSNPSNPEEAHALAIETTKVESLVSAVLMALRGLAMIASGFVGRAIVQSGQHVPVGKGYGAGRWKGLVVFTGVMMASASLGAVGLAKSRRREKGVGQVESGSESEE